MTITEFLEARIEEDEDVARAAIQGKWAAEGAGGTHQIEVSNDQGELRFFAEWSDDPTEDWASTAEHIARHDPARVLAECAAKRAIVEECRKLEDNTNWYILGMDSDILKHIAAVYASHPDYRQEWAV